MHMDLKLLEMALIKYVTYKDKKKAKGKNISLSVLYLREKTKLLKRTICIRSILLSIDKSKYSEGSLYENYLKIKFVNKCKWQKNEHRKVKCNMCSVNLFSFLNFSIFISFCHQVSSK